MSDDTEAEELLTRAMQGEQDAIHEVAQRLRAREEAISGHTVDAVNTLVTNRRNALAALDHFKSEFRDIADDPMAMALVEKLEVQEAHANPGDTNYLQRFRKVGSKVRGMRDGTEGVSDNEYAETVVDRMRMARGDPNKARQDRTVLSPDVVEENESDERAMRRWEREEAEREDERHDVIADMKRSREPRPLPHAQAGD